MQSQYRRCRKCRQYKPAEDFPTYRDKRYRRVYTSWQCHECWTAYRRDKWRTDEQHRRNTRNSELKIEYGITLDEYEQLAAEQKHVCAICQKPCSTNRTLAVDHCHSTGAIRGLLCRKCNAALGMFEDSPDLLRRAADYLEGK